MIIQKQWLLDALYMTSTLLKNQIKTEPSDKETDVVRRSEP